MISTDPDTRAAWAEYELLNAVANTEYQHRLSAVKDADRIAAARRLRLAGGEAA